jgi:hypothetical protein
MKVLKAVLYFWGLFTCFPSTAEAYLDPGAGSILLQVLSGILLSIIVFGKRLFRYVQTLFRKNN